MWHKRYITIESSVHDVRLVINARIGTYGKTVRIDNIGIEDGTCELPGILFFDI